jgi:hypothetical protein
MMNKLIGSTIGMLALGGALLNAQHVMPPGMSHEEHLRQLQKDRELKHRGAIAMGFDQDASVHHFLLQPGGGTILVKSRDAADEALISQIRAHFREIADAFRAGLFDKPLATHEELPPGAAAMTEQKDRITYRYVEHPNGASVVIETADPEAREAIHAFLRYQIVEHKTGDPLTLR